MIALTHNQLKIFKAFAQLSLFLAILFCMLYLYQQTLSAELPELHTPTFNEPRASADYDWFSLPDFLPVIERVKQ